MKLKRAIGIGALLYLVSFVIGMMTATLMGIDLSSASTVPTSVWIVSILLTLVLLYFFTIWYFKKEKPSAKEGALLGVVFIAVSTIIDLAIVIPYIITTDSVADIVTYYSNPLFWFTLVLIVGATTLIGYWKGKK
jgi:hypothetical protein